MTKSKSSANSFMEANQASTTTDSSSVASNDSTTTSSSTATRVSTTSASNVATSNTTSTATSASTAIPNPKVTSKDTTPVINNAVSALEETSVSAKEKKPAPPTTSTSTDAVPIESSSAAPALTPTSAPTAKVSAMDTTLAATGTILAAKKTVPAIKETSTTAAMDKKSTSKQDNLAEAAQEFVKPKVVGKVLELPVVNDTYDSLVKLSSPLNPYVEKIGTLASPAVDQALDFSASIEGKVPDVVQTSYASALKKVSVKNIKLNPNALTLKAATMAASLDATLCSGVDNLVEKVPALKQATPTLYNSTRCVS